MAPITRIGRLRALLDDATIVIGGGAVIWYLVLGPTAETDPGGALATSVSVAYPIGDLVLLIGLATLLLRQSRGGGVAPAHHAGQLAAVCHRADRLRDLDRRGVGKPFFRDLTRLRSLGAAGVIAKPFDPIVLPDEPAADRQRAPQRLNRLLKP